MNKFIEPQILIFCQVGDSCNINKGRWKLNLTLSVLSLPFEFYLRLCAVTFNPFSANFTKWSNTFKQFVGSLPTNCFSVLDHFVGLALKRLMIIFFRSSIRIYQMASLHIIRMNFNINFFK